jgi:hypothetical protein
MRLNTLGGGVFLFLPPDCGATSATGATLTAFFGASSSDDDDDDEEEDDEEEEDDDDDELELLELELESSRDRFFDADSSSAFLAT